MTAFADAVAVAALAGLVLTAYRHVSAVREAAVAVLAVAATFAVGALDAASLGETAAGLLPVVVFLAAVLVVADVSARAGLFVAAGQLVRRWSRDRPRRLFDGVFVLAALTTTVLSLDATVILLVPVVVGAARAASTSLTPGSYACLRMANSGSLLLPVSNLTNLLAVRRLDLDLVGFAAVMAPVFVAVLVVEYVGLRLLLRGAWRPARPAPPRAPEIALPVPAVPLAVVATMLAGFVVGSSLGLDPAWVASGAALALVAWGRRRGLVGLRTAAHAAHPSFAVYVLALGAVVAALADGGLGTLVAGVLPDSTSYAALLLTALVTTVLANLVTNLSATLLVLPVLAPLGTTAVLAGLIGLNVGSGLTYAGSLANLLWRRGLTRLGEPPSLREFHRVSLLLTPVSLVVAVTALWATTA